MNRVFPSCALILSALVLCLHLACTTTVPPKSSAVPPGMVLIPGGTFMMGCAEGDTECDDSEKPVHQVTVQAFYMDQTEVTVEAYRKCVNAGKCMAPIVSSEKMNWVHFRRENYPMNWVDWNQAREYCLWSEKRLPSEAEWEYAARGGHNRWKYPWGDEIKGSEAQFLRSDGSEDGTTAVATYQTNGYGLYDMAGNVCEWVEDCWHDDYSSSPTDGTAWTNGDCIARVLRGGSWANYDLNLRISNRHKSIPDSYGDESGFRCAKSAE